MLEFPFASKKSLLADLSLHLGSLVGGHCPNRRNHAGGFCIIQSPLFLLLVNLLPVGQHNQVPGSSGRKSLDLCLWEHMLDHLLSPLGLVVAASSLAVFN